MVEITYQMVLSTIQTISLVVGIIYYITIMRNQQKTQEQQLETRQTQVFMQIYQQLSSENSYRTFMELLNLEIIDNDEYLQKYDSSVNPDHYAKRAAIWYNYNTMGELLRMGIVERDLLVRLQLDTQVTLMWEKWEGIIRATRARENIPDIWKGFEYLYNEMKKYRVESGYTEITLTPPKPQVP